MNDTQELDSQLVKRLGWMETGTAFFAAQLAELNDADLLNASRLPGWTCRHVLSHIANNALALINLLSWARTGIETPMYPSRERRDAEIESGARRAASELRADVLATADRLSAVIEAMPPAAWDGPIRTALGREVTGSEVPWMRAREAWVHGVDLGAGATFADLDGAVVKALLDEAALSLAGRSDCPMVRLMTQDGEFFSIGPPGAAGVDVSGSVPSIAAWLFGRSDGSELVAEAGIPLLPTWP